MSNCCITSFAKGHNFHRGLLRLEKFTNDIVKVPFVGFTEYPIGCPTHQDSPFAFKFFCIEECRKLGYTSILWLDTSVVIKNNLQEIFDYIQTNGYFFIKNWHSVGQYCHDQALTTLGIEREQSFQIPCLQGTNFGLNFNFETTCKFQEQMLAYATDGITFPGPFDNKLLQASKDSRVTGHRHDQIAMSVVSLRLGMNIWWTLEEYRWFDHDRKFVKDVSSTVIDRNMSL